ncbi:MAG: hypothetical protein JWO67_3842 [Streptosporangiaceae bacterium]|nr:hypothetical protein [Streptosporangiaceae bacterium]
MSTESPPDSAEQHAHALERLAADIRRYGLEFGHMQAEAEAIEGEPIVRDGVAWENRKPTGRVVYRIELLINRKTKGESPEGEPDGQADRAT